jgi:hypothetical protein
LKTFMLIFPSRCAMLSAKRGSLHSSFTTRREIESNGPNEEARRVAH